MLLRIRIQNFLSFQKETSFDMLTDPKIEGLPHHISKDTPLPLLKQAAIYGANGAGKSNLIKAFVFLKNWVTNPKCLEEIEVCDYSFRMSDEDTKPPICLEVEFLSHQKAYLYKVAISEESIEESLYLSGLGKSTDTLIFERKDSKLLTHSLLNESAINELLTANKKASLLVLHQGLGASYNPELKVAYEWFEQQLCIVKYPSDNLQLAKQLTSDEKLFNFVEDIIQSCDLDIDGIEREEDSDELLFLQYGPDDSVGYIDIEELSEGTIQLLHLLPVLYQAQQSEKVVLIDAIEGQLHPRLLSALLQYYTDKTPQGQLIFTTHCTPLLDNPTLLRADEVWFAEKKEGASSLYSLSDFKLGNSLPIATAYLQGRYGAVPSISSLS